MGASPVSRNIRGRCGGHSSCMGSLLLKVTDLQIMPRLLGLQCACEQWQ